MSVGISDVFQAISGGIDRYSGFANYVKEAGQKNYYEFRQWFVKTQGFDIKSLKLFGHSRGAAVADYFMFLNYNDLYLAAQEKTLVRGSPLPSLGHPNHVTLEDVDVVNIVIVGNEFRDPFTKFNKKFYHPHGRNIFLQFN